MQIVVFCFLYTFLISIFFSIINGTIKFKHSINVDWVILYTFLAFGTNWNSKMEKTAEPFDRKLGMNVYQFNVLSDD